MSRIHLEFLRRLLTTHNDNDAPSLHMWLLGDMRITCAREVRGGAVARACGVVWSSSHANFCGACSICCSACSVCCSACSACSAACSACSAC